ncbi:hypothetical protein ACQPZU_01830 [Saccharomonospora azurea]|uniref:Uncharacterized protein n=1 Tax=Saccharomonospora azurea NA-128 TaxID=882081 RepID=H8GEV2_9PSEU|nr:hypothetical protein [Saccharomonospora azurea]EHY90013.1 hypothetical protein SacazDRAFT_03132 [Saccharomonospora azurea NA-128]
MSEIQRPEPASAELVERADRVHATMVDRVASTVGYWTPEIAGTVVVGCSGAVLLHPVVLPIAGTVLAARIVLARLAFRRYQHHRAPRRDQFGRTHRDRPTDTAPATGAEGREGIA